jgi:hypothetical protein
MHESRQFGSIKEATICQGYIEGRRTVALAQNEAIAVWHCRVSWVNVQNAIEQRGHNVDHRKVATDVALASCVNCVDDLSSSISGDVTQNLGLACLICCLEATAKSVETINCARIRPEFYVCAMRHFEYLFTNDYLCRTAFIQDTRNANRAQAWGMNWRRDVLSERITKQQSLQSSSGSVKI